MYQNQPQLYRFSLAEAVRADEKALYNASMTANIACANTLKDDTAKRYDGLRLGSTEVIQNAIANYGFDRTAWVLANTVKRYDQDGRLSKKNKEWAATIQQPKEDNFDFLLDPIHVGLVNLLVDAYRKAYNELNLWDAEEYEATHGENFERKVMILNPMQLKDQYKNRDTQLVFVNRGPGCRPGGFSDTIHCTFLKDGDKMVCARGDILGAPKPELMPAWAIEKASEIR